MIQYYGKDRHRTQTIYFRSVRNGFIQFDVYKMPTYLRNFYYNKLVDAKKAEKKANDKANKNIKSPSGGHALLLY